MLKVGRRADRHHRGDIRQRGSGYDRSRSTQAVPDMRAGGIPAAAMASAAALRSSTSEAKLTASSAGLAIPVPAKSNRKTPIPARESARAMYTAARLSFPQVKQWAKIRPAAGKVPLALQVPG